MGCWRSCLTAPTTTQPDMATRAESFRDGLAWVGRLLVVTARRAAVLGVLVALFALATWWTTRERVSDCSDVTAEQVELIRSLRAPLAGYSFVVAEPPACRDGEFTAPVDGVDDDMEAASQALLDDGLALDGEFVPFFALEWRRCFRFPDPGWERIELEIGGRRSGVVDRIEVRAPETGDACDRRRY